MAVIKAADIVKYVVDAKNAGWGYVFSAQGELYTPALAEQWGKANRAGKGYDYFAKRCARWFGRIVVDCSGLIIQAYRSQIPGYGDKTANTIYSKAVQTGPISTIPEIPGLCVWHSGHIGVYIGDGKVIEAAGTNIGVVLSALHAPAGTTPWTNWGKMADVYYGAAAGMPVEEPPACWLGRYLKLTSPYMHGGDVMQLQAALEAKGFSPGPVDGIFGPKTQKAVQDFQASAALTVDGIVGPNTIHALLGVWVTDCDGKPCCPTGDIPTDAIHVGRFIRITSPFMQGDDVREVQDALILLGYNPGVADGVYGPKTHGAVIALQQAMGLTVDGIVGPRTTEALGGVWTGA